MFKKSIVLGSAFALAFGVIGCSQSNSGSADQESQLKGSLTAVGSTAMQPLVEEAANQFTAKNPGVQVNVQGGGSGTGLSSAVDGSADIGNSDVFAEEKDGIDAAKIEDHKVFVVGMGPVVNPKTGVEDLTQKQLIDIFTGKVKNWKEVGGKDQEIVLVNRPESSGTRSTFQTFALNGQDEHRAKGGIEEDSSGTVKKIVSETPGAIGYLAFSYFDDSVKPVKLEGVEPKNENVHTGKWKVWAYQHMYTPKESENQELAKAFIDYILSDEIQNDLIPQLGYIPVTQMKVERDASGKVTEK
ncbi:phosphate transport system substrate-binding protein [Kroppenstedtia sanguinis]|uniref:phosphate ABC transporter substrate-binding protein PstS family protein n=1 Tax=Kroppenstedtia sanguinis TaxID=1380684 RepID=UPI003D204275